MKVELKRLISLILLLTTCISLLPQAYAQEGEGNEEIAQLMSRMSSAEKVGQLFLVTFPGAEVTAEAAITELIRDYHVGGVALSSENGNIINEGNTLTQVSTLISELQGTAWEATQPLTDTVIEGELVTEPFIPLFIAVNQEGNGMPFTAIISGTTPLPSEMALGATWNPSHTHTVGRIVGQELSVLGINMLLGPSLDVIENPRPSATTLHAGDMGVRSFGGEPFWVGQMGKAYIQGVHQGGEGKMAVVAKHFPGLGSSERSLDEEISTVQRTLEKLRQVDLAPFFAVAQAEDPLMRPDGMMVSHIRFRGLEGGRFVTTRPISVDSQVLQRLLGLPELAGWREQGGVTVSDGLGIRGLRRFYDPSEQSFNSRRIAQEAFLAGNDLLLLSQFSPNGEWEDQINNIKSTITFFREKYENEPSFQALVDAAVARILRLKLKLYGGTLPSLPIPTDVENIGLQDVEEKDQTRQSNIEAISTIARDAVTLLSPPSSDLVPSPPIPDDNIVIFTNDRMGKPCAACEPIPYIDPRKLENTIVRLYGPDGTGQIDPDRVQSFTFNQLATYMGAPPLPPQEEETEPPADEVITPTLTPPSPVEAALQEADWVIFAILDPTGSAPKGEIVRQFLAQRADALRSAYMIVLAYDAPYYLDATEISKLSAYYVAYSRIEPFIEASIRTLFGEFAPKGTPPVSVSGINYDLLTQTSPDPDQTIPLYYHVTKPAETEEDVTPEPTQESQLTPEPTAEGAPTPEPRLEEGDELRLYTGEILDHNGHLVPDGTPVQFIFTYPQEGLEQSAMATTRGGIAETAITLNRTGQLDIAVQADPVPRTVALQITIQEGKPATIVTPTPSPTPTPTSTPTPVIEPVVEERQETPTPSPTPTPMQPVEEDTPTEESGILSLLLGLISVLTIGISGYYIMRLDQSSVSQAMRLGLWCIIGGLLLYLAYVLYLRRAAWLHVQNASWTAGGFALVGSAAPLIAVWIFRQLKRDED